MEPKNIKIAVQFIDLFFSSMLPTHCFFLYTVSANPFCTTWLTTSADLLHNTLEMHLY